MEKYTNFNTPIRKKSIFEFKTKMGVMKILNLADCDLNILFCFYYYYLPFSTGTFPCSLKKANIIPIYKKEDHTLRNNYRPISLLSKINKAIEELVYTQLTTVLNKNAIFYEKQFGFRSNHSKTSALLEITKKIKQACDTGQFVCGVFLDIRKALDTVSHTILFKKITPSRIRVCNKWFQFL